MTEFIVYAALFRLTIFAVGLACVYMGYRLFVLGVMPREGSDVDAKFAEVRLTLKNAAPGTCFAAFGVFLMAVMLVQGNPELNEAYSANRDSTARTLVMRGDEASSGLSAGKAFEDSGRYEEAIRAYAQPLSNSDLSLRDAVPYLRALASVYAKQERYDESLAYIRLAIQVDAVNARSLATLARVQWARGEITGAVEAMRRASSLDPTLKNELDQMTRQ